MYVSYPSISINAYRGELVAQEDVDGEGGQRDGDGHDVPGEARHC